MPFTSLPNQLPLASSLPKISFKKISQQEIDQLQIPAGVTSQQNVNFGFNDGSHFDKPRHYLRHVEPIESERNGTVEYDMDEQDQEWLEALNTSRRNVGLDNISYEVFEIIIDRLEKEWFDLMKLLPTPRRPNPTTATAEEDGAGEEGDTNCAICDDGECENSNAIVFCDGCNLAVHQDCYGIPYIPEGQWLCRKCTVSPDRAVSCILCPHEGGAFKQTSQGKWAHLLCAMWIPETGVSNAVYMEPIDSVERIPKARWKLQCYLCRQKTGACIQCDNRSCFTAFHVTCAQKAGLLLKSTRQRAHGNGASSYAANASGSNQNSNGVDTDMNDLEEEDDEEEEELEEEVLKACCHKHLPSDLKAQRLEKALKLGYKDELGLLEKANPRKRGIKLVSRSNAAANNNNNEKSKAAAAYRKSYRPRPFLVPSYILNKVYDHVAKIQVRNKKPLVAQVARFWSLKRERRRGAPLLKRLHLEPWTATTSNQEVTDAQKKKKLEFIMQLRADLERIRMLTELVRRREKDKLRGAQQLRNVLVQGKLFPCAAKMRKALERIAAFDRNSYFLEPVPRDEVPDYYEVITEPMDWETILARLDTLYHYESISAFQADVRLVFKNALTYNTPDTAYHRAALKIQASAEPVLAELDELKQAHGDSVDAVDEALDPQEEFQISEVEPSNALLLEIKNYEDQELRDLMEACDDEDVGNEPVTSLEDWVKVWHRLSANKRTLPIISAAPMTSSDDADSKTGWKGGNRKKKRGGTRWTKPRDRSRNSRKNPNSQKSGAGEEEEEEANSDYDVSQVNEGLEKEEAPEHQEDVDAMDLDQNQNENEPSKQLVEPDQELLLNSLQETSEQETSKQEKESAVEQPRASPSPELSRRLRTRSGAAKEVDTSSNAQNQSQPQIPAEDEVEETSVAAIDLQPPQEADADVTMEDATVPSQTSQNPAQVEETEKEEPPEPTSPRSRTRSSRQNQETNLPEETPQVEPLPIEKAEPSQQPEAEKAPNKEQPKEELATATPSRPKKGGTNRGKKRGYRGQFASKASSLDDDPDSAEAKKARDEARKAALDAEHEAAKQAADDADGEGEGDAEVDAESSAEYNRKKRARIANPESLQVEDLDNWDTFIRFEQGWVLPEGSTRRRVPPPQRPPLFTSTSTGPPASGSKSTLSVQGAADAAQSSDTASNKGKQRASSDPKKGSSNSNGKRARASTSVSASTSTNSKARPKQLKTSSTSEAAAAAAEEPEEVSDASSTEYFERPFARNKDGHFVKIDSADAVERGVMFSKRPAKGSRARGTSEERKERRKAKARERAKNRTAEKRREREQNEEDLSNSNVSNSNLTLNRSNSNPLAFDDASDSPLTEELSDLSSSEEDQSEDKDGDETEEEEEDDDESVVGDGEDDGRMENESPEEAHRRKLAVRRERDRLRKVQRANQNAELSESAKAEAKHQAQLARRRERDRARREKQKKERERGGGSTSKSGTSSSTLAGTSTRPRSTLQSGGQSSTTQLDYSTSSSAASNSRSQQPKPKKVDDDAEDDNPADRGKVKIPPKPSKVLSIQGEPEDFSEQGTLVWAKMTGYPWFPAETYDENNVDKIPSNVLNSCPESADDVVHHLVRFFDNQRSWVWLPTRNLRFMFEDEEQDQKMLTPRENSSARRVRKDIREAYQRAQEAAEDNGTGTSVA